MMKTIQIPTHLHSEMINLDRELRVYLDEIKAENGTLTIFIPHTTAAVTINENADPDVKRDILYEIDKIIPLHDGYHHAEGNSAAHLKASFFGNSETVIIQNGKMQLGTWQSIFFCEFDGPRSRKAYLNYTASVSPKYN
jgi:secondary thiamine-phosphate synthase enzyme